MDMVAGVLNLIINIVMGATFTIIGIYANKRKEPMWFWSGSTVSPHEINDIPAYNKANGAMWLIYSMFFWLSGTLYFWRPNVGIALMILAFFPGFPVLIWNFYRIKRKYRRQKE